MIQFCHLVSVIEILFYFAVQFFDMNIFDIDFPDIRLKVEGWWQFIKISHYTCSSTVPTEPFMVTYVNYEFSHVNDIIPSHSMAMRKGIGCIEYLFYCLEILNHDFMVILKGMWIALYSLNVIIKTLYYNTYNILLLLICCRCV